MRTDLPYSFLHVTKRLLLCSLLSLMAWGTKAQSWANINGFGSLDAESGRGVCTDASGNVYYIGMFSNTIDFNPDAGVASLVSAGETDVVISKFNAAGVFQWAVRGGGVNGDVGIGIATNGTDVFVTGTYVGAASFGSTNLNSLSGNTDVFVAKLNAGTGVFTWAVSVGGVSGDAVYNICLDASGNPYIIGTYFTSITLGGSPITPTGSAGGDTFIAKLNGSTGAVLWGLGGGSSGLGDNGGGAAGICYVPGVDEIVAVCTFSTNAATYGGVTITGGVGTGNNLALLEINAANGTAISGVGLNSTGSEEGFAVCYDPSTQDVILTGYFDGGSATFGSTTLTNSSTSDEVFVARYSISSNDFVWAVKPTSGGIVDDRSWSICSNAQGQIIITGQYENSITFGTTTLTATGAASDIFVAGLAASNGAWAWALKGGSNDVGLDEAGRSVSVGGPLNKIAIVGTYTATATFGALPSITTVGDNDLFIAQLSGALSASVAGTNATCTNGCNGSATVTASGGTAPYTYSWSPSGGSAATATGLCVGTYTVTITPAVGTSIQRNVVIGLPATQLAATATNNTTSVNASNTNIYDASCNLIATVTPNGGTPVTGNVTARVWFEGGAPVYGPTGQVYVSRHYEIQPATNAANAMARITLYFTQAEFTAFNGAPGSVLDLPTGPADNARKANLRVTKLNGTSSNTTGLPGTYTNGGMLIDPVDTDIIWNATLSRWEVSFDVTGFSGFFVQTSLTALPLTWLDLKGYLDAEDHTVIDWKVEEKQVVAYSVEKSVNGQAFLTIGNIASAGDGEHTYSFRDPQALAGAATYRIKQTDLDGRYTYSRSILIRPNRNAGITLYPNPVKQTATLNITDPALMNTPALLVDGAGRLVQRIQVQQSVTTIDMTKCNPGIYMLKLQDGTNIKIFKE